jgi:UrcA family protein
MPLANIQTFNPRGPRGRGGFAAIAAGLICAALVAGADDAHAGPVRRVFSWNPMDLVRQTTVGYSDLDLTTTRGARTLLERIEQASDEVCGGARLATSFVERHQFDACRVAAASRAVRKVHNPLLSSLASDRRRVLFAAQ